MRSGSVIICAASAWLLWVLTALLSAFHDVGDAEIQVAARRLTAEPEITPWAVLGGSGCELVEDGCIQTTGFPTLPANESCLILATFSAYILDVISFDTEADFDTLTVNGVAYSGKTLKQSLVFGSMHWSTSSGSSSSASSGWKICPRSPCSTMACPDGYASRPSSQNIACASLACNATTDLDTCCKAKCTAPVGFKSAGYVLSTEGGCPGSAAPYHSYYSEVTCPIGCASSQESFASGMTSPVSTCPAPGEYLLPELCVEPLEDAPQWTVTGACELFGPDCVQSAGFPGPYASGCSLQLSGDFQITTLAFDLEDGFDFLRVDGVLSATGVSAPDPFVLRQGSEITFLVDADMARTGFRMCARALCSQVSCPSGYVFLCSEVDTPCSGLYCEDRNETCCRAANMTELLSMSNNSLSDALSEGCVTTTTTTPTTTTTTHPLGQIVGVAIFQVRELNSSHILDAWQLVLANLTGRPLEDIFLFPVDEPANRSALSDWQVGYTVQRVLQDLGPPEPGPDYLPFPVDYPLPQSIDLLDGLFQNEVTPISSGGHQASLSMNTAMQRSGPIIFEPGPNAMCIDAPNWVDDHRFDCDIYSILCTPFGTSSFESVSFSPGYYWYFYNSVTRSDPTELDARQACCACGGGSCGAGTYRLSDSRPDFCVPCPLGHVGVAPGQVGACTPCAAGTFSPIPAGSPICLDAPAGFSAPWPAMGAPVPCFPGTFTGVAGEIHCLPCPAGTASDAVLAQDCSPCQGGRFAGSEGLTSCVACASGTFANGTGFSLCDDCPAGTTSAEGQPACDECLAGRFNDEPGRDGCDACPPGRHASTPGTSECELCDPGYYASSPGMADCEVCPAGQQVDVVGATACEGCPIGEAKIVDNLFCSACSPGRYAPRVGEIECLACQTGRFMNESGATNCVECPQGRASDTTGQSECPACLPGQYLYSTGETVCLECNQGHFASEFAVTECDACAPGTASAAEGMTACIPCLPGRHAPNPSATRCEDCASSTFADSDGMSECLVCPLGRFALIPGLTACFNCQPGRYAGTNGSSECTQCEYGRYTGDHESTSCMECSASLPGPPEHWTTMYAVNTTGELMWLEMLSATSVSSCGCRPGTQPDGAAEIDYVGGGSPSDPIGGRGRGCTPCGEGLNCLGMGQLRILDGYAWDFQLSVYDCVHAVLDACRGGVPGACAPGRDETKIACAECKAGWVPTTDGSCAECGGADYGVPVTMLFIVLFLAFLSYMVYDRAGERKRPSLTSLLILISMGQLLTIVQQLGILSSIRVEWGSPLSDILDFISAIGFLDVDLLRPACMISINPVRSYGLRVTAVYVALLLVIAAHAMSTYAQHRGRRAAKHWYILFCALGTIVMAFFVSIITTMLAPLQCKKHPNDKRTISWFPSVVCWEDDEHTTMLGIGIVACTLPIIFLVAASWAAYVFPTELKKGSPRFLTGWAFLFFRYHTEAYWYGPVQLIRNALIAVAPVIHTAVLQTIFLQLVMLSSLVIVANSMPWRAKFANYLEVIMHFCFLSLVLCACFFVDEEPRDELAIFGTILILAMPTGIFVLVGIGLFKFFRSRGKPYQFFLCHHKVGAGSFSRLLKMQLLKARGVARKVFVDTDDLQNLGKLFDIVDQSTECIVAIHSSHLLTRPWCVGEIATAYRAKVYMQVVRLHAVEKPTAHFIENFEGFIADTTCLTENGIGLELVQQALQHFQSLTAIHLPIELQDKSVVALASTLVGRTFASLSHDVAAEAGEAVPDECLLIICDKMDLEAASAAFILKELIIPIIAQKFQVTAHVLTHGRPLGGKISKVALLCTSGLFENPIVTKLLDLHDESQSVSILPLMCSSAFVFPTPQVLKDSVVLRELPAERRETFVTLTQSIFTEIAVEFAPAALGATELVLTSRANDVANRLWSNMQSIHARMSQSTTIKSKGNDRYDSSGQGGRGSSSAVVPNDSTTAIPQSDDAQLAAAQAVDVLFLSEGSKASASGWSI